MTVPHAAHGTDTAVASENPHFSMRGVVVSALLIVVIYLALGLCIIAWHPPPTEIGLGAISSADELSLLNGAVTALALYAVFFQVTQARREGTERAAEERREAALRADQLHAEYNSPEMQRPRVIAYEYLKFLKRDPALLDGFARNWVLDEDEDCPVPAVSTAYGSKLTFNEYSAALDAMIAFFVRVSSHVRSHEPRLAGGAEERLQMIGSFFWSYWWQAGMAELIAACQRVHNDPANSSKYDRPYFIEALNRLQHFSQSHGAPARSAHSHPPQINSPPLPAEVRSSARAETTCEH